MTSWAEFGDISRNKICELLWRNIPVGRDKLMSDFYILWNRHCLLFWSVFITQINTFNLSRTCYRRKLKLNHSSVELVSLPYENIILKITLIQPYWKTTETTFTIDNHTEIFYLITQKNVFYCYSRMLLPYNLTEKFQRYPYPLFSQFSALLCFFSDLQCHILIDFIVYRIIPLCTLHYYVNQNLPIFHSGFGLHL